jgi:hypothetical protein
LDKREQVCAKHLIDDEWGRISLSCNLSLAPGFSPVGAGDAAPSRFNGLVAAGA